jgi:putative thioredoxin
MANASVIEVTDQTFASAVVEESRRRPVVVDFWAAWCQPCLMIGPVLERLAEEKAGAFLLAKLDVDSNPQASAAFGIQSIPAVKGFREGRLVDEFVGVIPETAIRQFLEALLPTEADRLVQDAAGAEREGRIEDAEGLYRQARSLDQAHAGAALGLGRLAALRGDAEAARALLTALRPDPEAERLLSAIEVAEWAEGGDGSGPLAEAGRAAAEGRFAEALDGFLREIREGDRREEARDAMLKLFAVLGDDDPLTRDYRRRLAAALF